MRISEYSNVNIDGESTSITLVQNDAGIYFIWFVDTRDIDYFKTTGYILFKKDEKWHLKPVNKNGAYPENIKEVLKHITETKPDWQQDF